MKGTQKTQSIGVKAFMQVPAEQTTKFYDAVTAAFVQTLEDTAEKAENKEEILKHVQELKDRKVSEKDLGKFVEVNLDFSLERVSPIEVAVFSGSIGDLLSQLFGR